MKWSSYLDKLILYLGTIAWSEDSSGGWLLYSLYQVVKSLRKSNFGADLLKILTDTAGKMAQEMQSYCPSLPQYNEAKAAAVVYHRLRKDIYFEPKTEKCDVVAKV